MTSVRPGNTPISKPMTMPMKSIAMLSGVRQLTKPWASWVRMSIMRSPQARDRKKDIGYAIKRRNAARQRNVGNTQEQDAAEDRHQRTGAPDRPMRAIAAHVHACCKKQECAENEAEHRHQHRVDGHQYDAADQQARI